MTKRDEGRKKGMVGRKEEGWREVGREKREERREKREERREE
jgi:hypothetical protein